MIMDNKWEKVIQWVKWRQWKKILNNLSDGLKRFGISVKWIWNKFVEWLGWIIVPIAFFTLIAILIIACINFFSINDHVQCIIDQIDAETSFSKYKMKMNSLKKGVFDSNVLTFMVTLIIVFLGTILLNIENRARKHILKSEKTMHRLESERNAMSLYTRIHMLLVFFANKNYYRLAKETEELLGEFRNDKYKNITKEWKSDFDKIIHYKMLYFLNIDEKRDKKNKTDIKKSIDALIKLQKEILRLKEV